MPQASPRVLTACRLARHLPRSGLFAAFAFLLGLGLTACGDAGEGAPSAAGCATSGPQQITVVGNDKLKFDHACYTAAAGEITFNYLLSPESNQIHDLRLDGRDGLFLEVDALSREATGSVSLDSGTYELFCSISGHRRAGMEAKLVVT